MRCIYRVCSWVHSLVSSFTDFIKEAVHNFDTESEFQMYGPLFDINDPLSWQADAYNMMCMQCRNYRDDAGGPVCVEPLAQGEDMSLSPVSQFRSEDRDMPVSQEDRVKVFQDLETLLDPFYMHLNNMVSLAPAADAETKLFCRDVIAEAVVRFRELITKAEETATVLEQTPDPQPQPDPQP